MSAQQLVDLLEGGPWETDGESYEQLIHNATQRIQADAKEIERLLVSDACMKSYKTRIIKVIQKLEYPTAGWVETVSDVLDILRARPGTFEGLFDDD